MIDSADGAADGTDQGDVDGAGDGPADDADDPILVLHVDDDPDVLALAAEFLARENDAFELRSETSAEAGVAVIEEVDLDCVVSDYRMPGTDGLEFLSQVRAAHPHLPFVLFTGQGSEEIAADAISAGVTDYLQKGTDPSQYTVLANRVENAAAQYRTEQELARTRRGFEKLIEHSAEVIPILDETGVVQYVTPSVRRVLGYEPEEVVGDNAFDYIHPDDVDRAAERFAESLEDPHSFPDVEYRFRHADGSWVHLYGRAINLLDDPDVGGIVSYNRDVTDLQSE